MVQTKTEMKEWADLVVATSEESYTYGYARGMLYGLMIGTAGGMLLIMSIYWMIGKY